MFTGSKKNTQIITLDKNTDLIKNISFTWLCVTTEPPNKENTKSTSTQPNNTLPENWTATQQLFDMDLPRLQNPQHLYANLSRALQKSADIKTNHCLLVSCHDTLETNWKSTSTSDGRGKVNLTLSYKTPNSHDEQFRVTFSCKLLNNEEKLGNEFISFCKILVINGIIPWDPERMTQIWINPITPHGTIEKVKVIRTDAIAILDQWSTNNSEDTKLKPVFQSKTGFHKVLPLPDDNESISTWYPELFTFFQSFKNDEKDQIQNAIKALPNLTTISKAFYFNLLAISKTDLVKWANSTDQIALPVSFPDTGFEQKIILTEQNKLLKASFILLTIDALFSLDYSQHIHNKLKVYLFNVLQINYEKPCQDKTISARNFFANIITQFSLSHVLLALLEYENTPNKKTPTLFNLVDIDNNELIQPLIHQILSQYKHYELKIDEPKVNIIHRWLYNHQESLVDSLTQIDDDKDSNQNDNLSRLIDILTTDTLMKPDLFSEQPQQNILRFLARCGQVHHLINVITKKPREDIDSFLVSGNIWGELIRYLLTKPVSSTQLEIEFAEGNLKKLFSNTQDALTPLYVLSSVFQIGMIAIAHTHLYLKNTSPNLICQATNEEKFSKFSDIVAILKPLIDKSSNTCMMNIEFPITNKNQSKIIKSCTPQVFFIEYLHFLDTKINSIEESIADPNQTSSLDMFKMHLNRYTLAKNCAYALLVYLLCLPKSFSGKKMLLSSDPAWNSSDNSIKQIAFKQLLKSLFAQKNFIRHISQEKQPDSNNELTNYVVKILSGCVSNKETGFQFLFGSFAVQILEVSYKKFSIQKTPPVFALLDIDNNIIHSSYLLDCLSHIEKNANLNFSLVPSLAKILQYCIEDNHLLPEKTKINIINTLLGLMELLDKSETLNILVTTAKERLEFYSKNVFNPQTIQHNRLLLLCQQLINQPEYAPIFRQKLFSEARALKKIHLIDLFRYALEYNPTSGGQATLINELLNLLLIDSNDLQPDSSSSSSSSSSSHLTQSLEQHPFCLTDNNNTSWEFVGLMITYTLNTKDLQPIESLLTTRWPEKAWPGLKIMENQSDSSVTQFWERLFKETQHYTSILSVKKESRNGISDFNSSSSSAIPMSLPSHRTTQSSSQSTNSTETTMTKEETQIQKILELLYQHIINSNSENCKKYENIPAYIADWLLETLLTYVDSAAVKLSSTKSSIPLFSAQPKEKSSLRLILPMFFTFIHLIADSKPFIQAIAQLTNNGKSTLIAEIKRHKNQVIQALGGEKKCRDDLLLNQLIQNYEQAYEKIKTDANIEEFKGPQRAVKSS